jgi:adenylate cyclase
MDLETGPVLLTPRERQIALAYAGGQTYRDIATDLFIAPTTVRAHVGAVYRKLGVSSKIELSRVIGEPADVSRAPQGRAQCPSITVRPFDDRRPGSARAFSADALVESLSAGLSRFRFLFVLGGGLARVGGDANSTLDGSRPLATRYAVTGSLSRAGARLRVHVALLDTDTGGQVWTRRFECAGSQAADALDQLVLCMVAAIASEVEAHEIDRARHATGQLTAWQWCCRGLQDFPTHDSARMASARRCFERAILADPTLAFAPAQLARIHFYEVISGGSPDPVASGWQGLRLARTALALDDREETAYLALGYCLTMQGHTDDAIAALDYGLQLNPGNCNLYNARALARLFSPDGDYQRVLDDEAMALALSPNDALRWTAQTTIGWALLADERNASPKSALPVLRQAGTVANADWHVHVGIAIACLAEGDLAGAAQAVDEARRRCEGLSSAMIATVLAPLLARSSRLARWAARLPEVGLPRR